MRMRKTWIAVSATAAICGGTLALAAPAKAQMWEEQGPGPVYNGGDEGIDSGSGLGTPPNPAPDNPIAGAINIVALSTPPSPIPISSGSEPSAAASGTTNATSLTPTWKLTTPLVWP
jgi:hypothetical protein